MRIIAGSARGRRLKTLPGQAIRPTADRVKEALFSILASRVDIAGTEILDLFAGSGALGIEALSRGAARVTFVEQSAPAVAVLRANLEASRFVDQARILRARVDHGLERLALEEARFDGVLLDPPYGSDLVPQTLRRLDELALVRRGGWVLAEHHVDDPLDADYGGLQLTRSRRYGNTGLALFSMRS
jgi:16S rRNA (guanine(966)-N(2))-methyltransferase RsmD